MTLPSACTEILLAVMSLVAPKALTRLVPVTTSTPALASYVAEVMVGAVTLLTVTPLPVVSALAPLIQLAAAARLKGVLSNALVLF